MIREINWCNKELIVSERNKGLADSVISGVGSVFREYDAVIVIEDDCVLAPEFIKFMVQALTRYEQNQRYILSADIVGRSIWRETSMMHIAVGGFLVGAGAHGGDGKNAGRILIF